MVVVGGGGVREKRGGKHEERKYCFYFFKGVVQNNIWVSVMGVCDKCYFVDVGMELRGNEVWIN
jgi:hypothetical protein